MQLPVGRIVADQCGGSIGIEPGTSGKVIGAPAVGDIATALREHNVDIHRGSFIDGYGAGWGEAGDDGGAACAAARKALMRP